MPVFKNTILPLDKRLQIVAAFGTSMMLALLTYMLVTPKPFIVPQSLSLSDKMAHMCAGMVIAIGVTMSFARVNWALLLGLCLYGAMTEIIQHFVPGRSFSLYDQLANMLGYFLGLLTVYASYRQLGFLRPVST